MAFRCRSCGEDFTADEAEKPINLVNLRDLTLEERLELIGTLFERTSKKKDAENVEKG